MSSSKNGGGKTSEEWKKCKEEEEENDMVNYVIQEETHDDNFCQHGKMPKIVVASGESDVTKSHMTNISDREDVIKDPVADWTDLDRSGENWWERDRHFRRWLRENLHILLLKLNNNMSY